jgi:hypothetical protein
MIDILFSLLCSRIGMKEKSGERDWQAAVSAACSLSMEGVACKVELVCGSLINYCST